MRVKSRNKIFSFIGIKFYNETIYECSCGGEIKVTTNKYDNSNSGCGGCSDCPATIYIN